MGASHSCSYVTNGAVAPTRDETRAPSDLAMPSQATQATLITLIASQTDSQGHATQETTRVISSGQITQQATHIISSDQSASEAAIHRMSQTAILVQSPRATPRATLRVTMNLRDIQATRRRQIRAQARPSVQIRGPRMVPRPTMNLRDVQARRRQTAAQPFPFTQLETQQTARRETPHTTVGETTPAQQAAMDEFVTRRETPHTTVGETTPAQQAAMDEFVTRREMNEAMERMWEELQRRT
ncbi:hypothetical protein CFAM422_008553 [Trichoderma lentiforme]|uniref:Uncharacterized protein n=1 Tax=Trichoderma lentiforme TaxID=1567552 RepID=A0A9P4XBU1_9HYPO|nr:hypothetical protein CFAM422_008553 [Trichoderma lentiforme]